jgi:hypothetical protein
LFGDNHFQSFKNFPQSLKILFHSGDKRIRNTVLVLQIFFGSAGYENQGKFGRTDIGEVSEKIGCETLCLFYGGKGVFKSLVWVKRPARGHGQAFKIISQTNKHCSDFGQIIGLAGGFDVGVL